VVAEVWIYLILLHNLHCKIIHKCFLLSDLFLFYCSYLINLQPTTVAISSTFFSVHKKGKAKFLPIIRMTCRYSPARLSTLLHHSVNVREEVSAPLILLLLSLHVINVHINTAEITAQSLFLSEVDGDSAGRSYGDENRNLSEQRRKLEMA